jgi:hypothetical protein
LAGVAVPPRARAAVPGPGRLRDPKCALAPAARPPGGRRYCCDLNKKKKKREKTTFTLVVLGSGAPVTVLIYPSRKLKRERERGKKKKSQSDMKGLCLLCTFR